MIKKPSSKKWMQEHIQDEYVKKAQKDGYRSRAAYKLIEIIKKYKIINTGNKILDLGAAPGGWSQVSVKYSGDKGIVIASDILNIKEISRVNFIQGDFTKNNTYQKILAVTNNNKIDVVLSDMAPNISGQKSVDQPKSIYLNELALDMAEKILQKNGKFLVKIFQGTGFDDYVKKTKNIFKKVIIYKPKASRAKSKETYIIANQIK